MPDGRMRCKTGSYPVRSNPSSTDIHVYRCAGHDGMEATPDALDAIGVFLAGRTANITVLSPTSEVQQTLLAGRPVVA